MKRSSVSVVFLGLALAAPLATVVAQTQEFGIDRSNLTREPEALEEKALRDIHSLHATWFRDVLVTAPEPITKFLDEVRMAKQNDLKFLANVLPSKADIQGADHNQNAGEAFRKRCGWSQGSSKLSQLNTTDFAAHLRTQLDAVKEAGLTIDAFEIGNEVDWICFNGDVPDGHTPSDAEFMTAVRGYARFLKAAAEIIHDPHYFPDAKIITFGIAHSSDRWDRPPHHFSNPARMIAMLRNLDGFNYLDNTLYHVDGYGTHIYPNPDTLEESVTQLVRQDAAILGPDKPFWITEWGLAANKYPNKQGQTRGQAFKGFYDTLDKLHIPFGPPFYYAHSPGGSSLIDANGALLPEATALALRVSEQSSVPLQEQAADVQTEARTVVVGVNIWNEGFLSEAQQEAELEQMAGSGVKTIRTGLVPNNTDFIVKAYQHGIGSVVIVFPFRGTKSWSDVTLSQITPVEFTTKFRPMLDKLETAGVRLTAFELGNEINTSRFNSDLPDPGSGRELKLADLNNPDDPEGRAVAEGYRAYVQVMAALKDLRDHSKLNQNTPIISAGLAQKLGNKQDEVNLKDTIAFFRQNGIDKVVDGYGIHVYPTGDPSKAVSARIASLDEDMFSACSQGGKPCWVTEWGFGNSDESCPVADGTRVKLVQDMRTAFQRFADQGLLGGIIWYDWAEKPGKPDSWAIFRCDALTDAGRLALSPFTSPVPQGASAQNEDAGNPQSSSTPCMDCIRIRVGLPKVVQGPGPGIPDNLFTEIRLPNGHFQGFSASATTYAIDGATPWDMTGTPTPVLGKAPRGEYGESGEWINHVERSGKTLLGWVHDETGDKPGMGLQSMSMAVSENDGKSWRRLGQIITGTEGVVQGKITGVGNGDALDGKDGYYYAYCWWNSHPGGVIVARAPVTSPGPGNWKKYFNGGWSEPGLGGDAAKLDVGGTTVARWLATGETIILGQIPGGMGIYLSQDHVDFEPLPAPIIPGDNGSWRRPEPHDLSAYGTLLDANTGENQLGDHWLLAYMYVQPNEGMDKRYLVFRPVDISRSRQPDEPAAGILLARWSDPALHDRWSTTAPVPAANGSQYKLEAESGYLLTAPDPKRPSIELEECLNKPGQPVVHVLMQKAAHGRVCEDHGYTRSRTAGFVYASAQPGAQPLYSCYSESDKSHFAANTTDCDHLGKQDALLGYDLKE